LLELLVNLSKGNQLSPKNLLQNKLGRSYRRLVVDSRLATEGDLFIALQGARADGHDFLQQAKEMGSTAALVSRRMPVDIPQIVVPDPLSLLRETISEYLSTRKPRVIAITGSVGKTTTKEFLRQLLSTRFVVAATPGNANSQIGLPMAIFNDFVGDEDFWVLEMGMTHPGQIELLCKMVPPEIALVTHVAAVHVANFESIEGIAFAKAEIFSQPSTKIGFINAHAQCLPILLNAGSCSKVVVDDGEVRLRYPKLFLGEHLYQNLVLALEVAMHVGIPREILDAAVPQLSLATNRMELLEIGGVTILNDGYNASEISTIAVLNSVPACVRGKRIALIGQMMELGQHSDQVHRTVGGHALDKVDLMICYGEACRPIYDVWNEAKRPVFWTNDRSVLLTHLKDHLKTGDYLLLKGSRSNMLSELIPEIRTLL
jgi:UDP-N-acetylmuramoyl-tripeptide--D-alanyl-D-alanine ligase